MKIKNEQVAFIWKKVIEDMEDEDVVLELKVLDTKINDYNKLLKFVLRHLTNFDYLFEGKSENLPESITGKYFESEKTRELKINLSDNLNVYCGFNEEEQIEFFTDSVLRLKAEESTPLFEFVEDLGNILDKDVSVFVEAYPRPSFKYDFDRKKYEVYSGISLI